MDPRKSLVAIKSGKIRNSGRGFAAVSDGEFRISRKVSEHAVHSLRNQWREPEAVNHGSHGHVQADKQT